MLVLTVAIIWLSFCIMIAWKEIAKSKWNPKKLIAYPVLLVIDCLLWVMFSRTGTKWQALREESNV